MLFPKKEPTVSVEAVVSDDDSETKQERNVPYFPPPPASTLDASRRSSRSSKPLPQYTNFSRPPTFKRARRPSSIRHTTGLPSRSRKRRLQEAHLPAIRLSPRHWMLVGLLLLSFLVLILGFIFAECVSLPHTDRKDGSTSDDSSIENATLFSRQTDANPDLPIINTFPDNNPEDQDVSTTAGTSADGTPDASNTTSLGAGGTTSPSTTPSESLANESKRLGFDSPKNLAILFFYTATLPLMTIFHAIAELVVLWCANRRSSSARNDLSDDDSDSISNLKPLSLAKKHNIGNTSSNTKLGGMLGFLPAMSLTASILIICGWIIINAIQIHCEIPVPTISQDLADQAICPIQLRGHFMHGIHELSIVKIVFGWILVIVYIGYAVFCVRVNGMVWRAAREQRKARKQRSDIEGKREDQLKRTIVRFSITEDTESSVDPEKAKAQAAKVDVTVGYLAHS